MSKYLKSAALLCLFAAPALAQRNGPDAPPHALIDALARCLEIRVDAERLACGDRAGRALVDAAAKRELVVVDRTEARRTRRSLFGLPVDLGQVFAGRDRPEDRFEALETTVSSATELSEGRWRLVLAEGGEWRTVEALRISRAPRAGTPVTVRRGALGSYILRAQGSGAVRAERVN